MIEQGLLLTAAAVGVGLVSRTMCRRFARSKMPPTWVMIALDLAVLASAYAAGGTATLAATAGVGAVLAVLAVVDVIALRLPDLLTLPLLIAGLAFGPALTGYAIVDHVGGAAAGFAALAGLGWIFARIRGRDGIGLGDAKLLAAAGSWLGWQALPVVVVMASGAALLWVAVAALRHGRAAIAAPLPFGMPLCAAFWTMLLLTVHLA